MPVIKKTVAIHPIMNSYIRKTWAILIDKGYNATYSTALNLMLLAAIQETKKKEGLDDSALNIMQKFLNDVETIEELNLEEYSTSLDNSLSRKMYG